MKSFKITFSVAAVLSLCITAAAQSGGTRPVIISDPSFNNMPAYTGFVPANWKFEGTVLRGVGCGYETPGVVYRAYSPDQLTGVQAIPPAYWYYASDPRAYKLSFVEYCSKLPPISAADYGRMVSAKIRPGSEVDGVDADPSASKFTAQVQRFNSQMAASAASMGNPNPPKVTGDIARLRLHYEINGHLVEEWMSVSIQTIESTVPIQLSGPGEALRLAKGRLQTVAARVTLRRAPKGQLTISQFETFDNSIKEEDRYTQAYMERLRQQNQANMQAIRAAGQAVLAAGTAAHEALMANHRAFIQDFDRQGAQRNANFAAQMDRKSRSAQDFNDYVLDQQYYVNPVTGVKGTLSSGYRGSYQAPDGTIVQSMDQSSPGPNWIQLQPIHH
jgi:hypothetical protein